MFAQSISGPTLFVNKVMELNHVNQTVSCHFSSSWHQNVLKDKQAFKKLSQRNITAVAMFSKC